MVLATYYVLEGGGREGGDPHTPYRTSRDRGCSRAPVSATLWASARLRSLPSATSSVSAADVRPWGAAHEWAPSLEKTSLPASTSGKSRPALHAPTLDLPGGGVLSLVGSRGRREGQHDSSSDPPWLGPGVTPPWVLPHLRFLGSSGQPWRLSGCLH